MNNYFGNMYNNEKNLVNKTNYSKGLGLDENSAEVENYCIFNFGTCFTNTGSCGIFVGHCSFNESGCWIDGYQ